MIHDVTTSDARRFLREWEINARLPRKGRELRLVKPFAHPTTAAVIATKAIITRRRDVEPKYGIEFSFSND
jgi:hypothetical protein